MSPNNRMQRSGHDKVHAPDCPAIFSISDYAPQGRRAVADAGRWAALPAIWLYRLGFSSGPGSVACLTRIRRRPMSIPVEVLEAEVLSLPQADRARLIDRL